MRVAVLGAGAMGAIFGSALYRVGADVVFFDNRLDVVEAITSRGLILDGVLGAMTVRCSATTVAAELGSVDLALVGQRRVLSARRRKVTGWNSN